MQTIAEIRDMRATAIALLRQEIEERRNLLATLVGTLYPSIIRDEIRELRAILYALEGSKSASPPSRSGA